MNARSLARALLPTKPRTIEYCRSLVGRDLYENKVLRDGRIDEFRMEKSNLKRIAAYGISKKK